MLSFLNKPYPYFPFSFRDVRINFLIGLFIFLFLLLFQPFGLSEWRTDRETLKLMGFGTVSFITPLGFKLVCMLCFKTERWPDNWTVWKEILVIITVIVLIAFGNLLFAYGIGLAAFHIRPFLYALLATTLIGCFPVTLSVVLKYNRFLTLNEEDAGKMEAELHKRNSKPARPDNTQLIFTAENEKDKLGMFPDQLLYIESADNYSNVVFMQGELKNRELIRSSLKRLESQINNTHIIRCHRSFIVNLNAISHIEGNAQGYRISFKQVEDTVPVSRNYGKEILDRLKTLK
ncbi:MAG: LytR/AlgR family response regulator transcription factor [Bacteroidia bacterium]